MKNKNATLWWGYIPGRLGWFLTLPNNQNIAIHGPSICSTSGGGADAALNIAKEHYSGLINVIMSEHSSIYMKPCSCHFELVSKHIEIV